MHFHKNLLPPTYGVRGVRSESNIFNKMFKLKKKVHTCMYTNLIKQMSRKRRRSKFIANIFHICNANYYLSEIFYLVFMVISKGTVLSVK